jgi:hypothetical protein
MITDVEKEREGKKRLLCSEAFASICSRNGLSARVLTT